MIQGQSTKDHTEIISDPGLFCVQMEPGNPFSTRQHMQLSEDGNIQEHARSTCETTPAAVQQNVLAEWLNSSVEAEQEKASRYPANPNAQLGAANIHIQIGDYTRAIEILTSAANSNPNHIPVNAALARCYTIVGDLEHALEVYTKIESVNQDSSIVISNIAALHLRLNNVDAATNYIRRALELNKNDFSAHNNAGLLNLSQKKFDRAISSFRKARSINSKNAAPINNLGVCYAVQGDIKTAIGYFKTAHAVDTLHQDAVLNLITAYQDSGQNDNALTYLNDYLNTFGATSRYHSLCAWSHFQLANYDKALDELTKLHKLTPESDSKALASLFNNVAVVHGHLGNFDTAKAYYVRALKLCNGEDLTTYLNLIRHLLLMDDLNFAKLVIDGALSFFDGNPLVLCCLAEYYARTSEYEKSQSCYNQALLQDKSLLSPYVGLSSIYIDILDDTLRATSIINDGLKEHPSNLQLLNNLAYCHLMHNDTDSARSILDAIDVQNNIYITATRGLLLVKEGDIKEGSRLYNMAIKLAEKIPGLPELVSQKKYLELAKVALSQKKIRDALHMLEKGKKLKTLERHYYNQIISLIEKTRSEALGV